MTFLFIATIGPVQPFIASARRTRDLYVGSTLLSELSKAAAYAIIHQADKASSLIFPAPLDKNKLAPGSDLNVANKIVATIEQPPEQLGDLVRQAILDRLDQVKQATFTNIELASPDKANAQIENLIDYFWVAVPFANEQVYKNARKRAEAILGARKNTQNFSAAIWGTEDVHKSSIDGQRECVLPRRYYITSGNNNDPQVKAQKKENAAQLYKMYKAGPHEHLSAVDLLKRLAWRDDKQEDLPESLPLVLSTSHIAATPFLDSLEGMGQEEKAHAQQLWNKYIDTVRSLAPSPIVEYIAGTLPQPHPVTGYNDGALLFKERLLDDTEYTDILPSVNEKIEEFFRFTDAHLNGLRPSSYYAILRADGDGMGNAIDTHAEGGPAGHQAISQALAGFAHRVREIVNKTHHGSLIYAGGDDVLALLPLHTVLDCAKDLHDSFGEQLSRFKDKDRHSPTLSVGIAVVHHVSLLQDALTLAHEAVEKAKGHPGKDALAIVVKKRGGEPKEIVVSWKDEEERLALLIDLYNANIIPTGIAYELRTMMERLNVSFTQKKQEQETRVELQRIIQLEAARILRRKLYFSRERVTQPDPLDIETVLSNHLRPPEISAAMTTPQDQARYLLLRQINMQERPIGGFELQHTSDITPFVDALIVAQTFAQAIKPTRTKGFAE